MPEEPAQLTAALLDEFYSQLVRDSSHQCVDEHPNDDHEADIRLLDLLSGMTMEERVSVQGIQDGCWGW